MKWLMVLLLAAPATAQERADAPYSWARHKPGAFVKTRMSTFGSATVEYHRTLKEVTEKEVAFDLVTISIAEKGRKQEVIRVPLFRLGGEKPAEETLKFKGQDYKCRILKGNYEYAGMKSEGKYWIAEGVAFPLKTVEVGSGAQTWMNMTTESVLVNLEEEMVIAGRKLKCAKYEGMVKGTPSGAITMWVCADIPGGMARTVTKLGSTDAKMKMVVETIEFEVKK